jgi:TPR repeat protein
MKRRWVIVGIACMALICAGLFVRTQRNNHRLAKWAAVYRVRVERGDAKSRYALGAIYYYGKGVPHDYVEAVRWYRKSADQGYAHAQYDLAYMYYYGYSVPPDRVQAYDFFQQAATHGNEDAKRALEC